MENGKVGVKTEDWNPQDEIDKGNTILVKMSLKENLDKQGGQYDESKIVVCGCGRKALDDGEEPPFPHKKICTWCFVKQLQLNQRKGM